MFESVLIAEDQQGMNMYVQQQLTTLGFTLIKYAYYCDDALLRLKHGGADGRPFDLLITDLSFADDGREQTITDGSGLIAAARKQQHDLKILVFSAEPDAEIVAGLFQQLGIDGYVLKGRSDTVDLKNAVETIYSGKRYLPPQFQQAIRHKKSYNFTKIDLMIVAQLRKGTRQNKIPAYLESQGAKATSLSSVEKRLGLMRDALDFNTNEQLIAYCLERKFI